MLISCHACHPSLCNDNLSGLAVASRLAKYLGPLSLRYSYRFVFAPATIGAITWLARNQASAARIKHGLVLTGLGDPGPSTYKRSRRGDAEIDRVLAGVLAAAADGSSVVDFTPYGYDERQYCSPGFDLPVGCLMRTPWGRYPEYHTSADDLDFVRPEALADSFFKLLSAVAILEENRAYVNQSPYGEPQLGKRGLYRHLGGESKTPVDEQALLWVLNGSDGRQTLLDIATRAGLPFESISRAARVLAEHDLLSALLTAQSYGMSLSCGSRRVVRVGSWGWVQQLATIANGWLMPLKPVQISGPITTSEWLSGPRKISCTTPSVRDPWRPS